MEDDAYCLVLSGGGAKGVYHIGAWKALKEMGVRVEAFVGSSIGAVISGLLAQGQDDFLEELGRSIGVDDILKLPKELTEDGDIKLDFESLAAARSLYSRFAAGKGLDTGPLRKHLEERIDEAALRRSGKDLGIVTVNVTDMKPCELFIEDMEEGRVVDYLMASAAFPGFESPVIGGKKFVDGGLHDNIPYEVARRRGYRRIIVVDISGAGRNRKPRVEGSLTAYIKNSIDMGGVLDFDRDFLDAFGLLGYLDTLRVFGRLKGYGYFVDPDPAAEARFAAFLKERGRSLPAFPEAMSYDRDALLVLLECAASVLEVERVRRYSYASLAAAVAAKRAEVEGRITRVRGESLAARKGLFARTRLAKSRFGRGAASLIAAAIRNREFDDCPYYYHFAVGELFAGGPAELLRKALVGFFPCLPAGLAFFGIAEGFEP